MKLAFLAAGSLWAAVLPVMAAAPATGTIAPASVGFSAQRLQRVTTTIQSAVDRGEVPGAVTLVARHGKIVQINTVGLQNKDSQKPMRRDTIFRLASMTKPITSVAAMILVEEGKIRLSDPIERWLPEFAHPRVLLDPNGPLDQTRPATHSITVLDLLTHRSGIGRFSNDPLGQASRQASGTTLGTNPPDEWIKRVGALPLAFEPNTRWDYAYGMDVLSVLIARASGVSFEEFLRTRVFEPLGMKDTGFWVPKNKLDRFADCAPCDAMTVRPGKPAPTSAYQFNSDQWTTPPAFASGNGGLVSTADDYLKFAQMLVNHGTFNGVRILSRKSADLMTTNFITPEQRKFPMYDNKMPLAFSWDGAGFGLGMYVIEDVTRQNGLSSVGNFHWGGAFGTDWVGDRQEDLVVIMMIQSGPNNQLMADLSTSVYQALDD